MARIEAVPLGKTDVQVSSIGLGTAPLAGLYQTVNEARAIETIQYAYSQGITLFDSAPLYGTGAAEELMGKALAGIARDSYVISTKIGRLLDPESHKMTFDYSREGVLRSLEGSLRRLQTDRVDILHIHDPDDHPEEALDEAYPALDELRRQGVIKAIGAGMNQWQALMKFALNADFDCFLLAGRYTLLEQTSLEFLEICRQRNIGILLGGVFNSGILATGPKPGAKYQYAEAPEAVMEKARLLDEVCRRYHVGLSTAAIHFAHTHPAVTSLVLGAVSPQEVEQNLVSMESAVPVELWRDLATEGLIEPAAPTPDVKLG
jgi:D-threo-aldose 1-dehydrogenase